MKRWVPCDEAPIFSNLDLAKGWMWEYGEFNAVELQVRRFEQATRAK